MRKIFMVVTKKMVDNQTDWLKKSFFKNVYFSHKILKQ